jgi:hypothetical protein
MLSLGFETNSSGKPTRAGTAWRHGKQSKKPTDGPADFPGVRGFFFHSNYRLTSSA